MRQWAGGGERLTSDFDINYLLLVIAMYSKLAFGEHFYSDPEQDVPEIELPSVVPACSETGRDEKCFFHQLEVRVASSNRWIDDCCCAYIQHTFIHEEPEADRHVFVLTLYILYKRVPVGLAFLFLRGG